MADPTLRARIAAAALTVPIRLGPATIRNAQAGHTITRLSGSEADHISHVVMDVFANRVDTPAEGYDPRAEVEAHWGGDPEQLIAAWEDDQAQWRARVKELEDALFECGKAAEADDAPKDTEHLAGWATAAVSAYVQKTEADRVRRLAYTERRVELARGAEAKTWKRRMREEREAFDAEIAGQDQEIRGLTADNARLQRLSDRRWVGWRSACARAVDAREDAKTERFFAHAAEEELVKFRRAHKSLQNTATRYRTDRDDAWHTLENQEDEDVIREEGRREGIAELVAHLENVAAEARTGRDTGYPEESEGLGPTRWCLLTDRAHWLARKYADGRGAPVPDATARAQALEKELERVQGRHACEVVGLRREVADWKRCYHARERWAYELQAELHEVRTTTRRRELVLADRLRRRGERLRHVETRYALSELGANHVNQLLELATRFQDGPVTVTPHGEGKGWRCSWPAPDWPGNPGQGPTLTEDHVDRFDALARASQISAQAEADAALR
ncbi:hypothetical protein Q8791_22945 [Nocardiopsis sp. CT-R113]|uniref:Uncharacterized protein n=1 Tax=Nocardiopsis codii TaxID=3065942 RepID=A0ABU7KCW4_9ACTN|nr:hypothetical protein [Nocardiopsis sp. CT-R113]MEE2040078.1 hypothetical protein [Nocardiopsis sp. CT-R113]